jgi:hypothetical protein
MSKNRTAQKDRNEKMIAGVKKHFGNSPTITLGGVARTPAEVEQILQDPIDKAATTITAEATFHGAVAAEDAASVLANGVFLALKKIVLGQFGGDAVTLADFGIVPPAKHAPSTEVKAGAVVKARATRQARGTKGPKAKKAIKGNPPAAPPKPA